jgi:hypothetical protein
MENMSTGKLLLESRDNFTRTYRASFLFPFENYENDID